MNEAAAVETDDRVGQMVNEMLEQDASYEAYMMGVALEQFAQRVWNDYHDCRDIGMTAQEAAAYCAEIHDLPVEVVWQEVVTRS